MANYDPNAAAQNWVNNLSGSTNKIKAGVQAVTVSPGALAAKAAPLWAANTQAAQSKYQRNVGNVTVQQWQDATINKGLGRIASGAQAAQSKVLAFQTQFLPYVQKTVASAPARGTTEQNIQRAVAVMQGLHNFSYNKQGA